MLPETREADDVLALVQGKSVLAWPVRGISRQHAKALVSPVNPGYQVRYRLERAWPWLTAALNGATTSTLTVPVPLTWPGYINRCRWWAF